MMYTYWTTTQKPEKKIKIFLIAIFITMDWIDHVPYISGFVDHMVSFIATQ